MMFLEISYCWFQSGLYIPCWTVRADISLYIHVDILKDIRKIKDVYVELSVQPRISTVNFALGYS